MHDSPTYQGSRQLAVGLPGGLKFDLSLLQSGGQVDGALFQLGTTLPAALQRTVQGVA